VGQEVAATSDVVVTPGGGRAGAAPPDDPGAPDQPPEDSPGAFVRHTAVMSVGTALSRVTGFLRLAAMAYAIGITESQLPYAYNVANVTPNIVYELALGGILTSVVVPVVVEWLQERGRDEAWDVVRRLVTFVAITLAALTVLSIVFAPWIVDLYTTGVTRDREAVRELGTFFLRWFMPQIVFYGIGAVAIGLLNAHRRFAAPMFAPILNNLIVIATFIAFSLLAGPAAGSRELATTAQRFVLAIGTTAGVVGMTIVLWPSVRATGFRFRWTTGWRHEAIRTIVRLSLWVFVYVLANQVLVLVVIVLSGGVEGGYPAYAAAFILFQLPHAIFAVSIFTALLPAMSGRWAARDLDGFRRFLSQGLRATAAIVIPASLGYVVLARPIVRLLLEHGATGTSSGDLVADTLVAFAVGLVPFSAFQLLLRACYSMQDTRTPAIVNVAAVAINVALDLVFFFPLDLGIQGLALGFALEYVFGVVALGVIVRRRLRGLDGRRVAVSIGRTVAAALPTAGVAWLVARWLGDAVGIASLADQAVQVLAAVGAGLVVFVAAATVLRIEEVAMVRDQVIARWRR
jgi:putative peptidoglycan lipid II flippase